MSSKSTESHGASYEKMLARRESIGRLLTNKKRWELWKVWKFRVVSFAVVFIWLFVASVFYTHVNGWTSAQGFYFAVQSGLSVGFGAAGTTCTEADSERPNACRWYSIFHILVGSSLISTAFGMFLNVVVNEADEKKQKAREREKERLLHGNRKGDADEAAIPAYKRFLRNLIDLGIVRALKLTAVFILLISIGVIYGLTHERRDSAEAPWNFVTALLYAVSALSTGGLVAPSVDNTAMWFTGWYCLVGVPVYGLLLATASSVLAAKQAEAERQMAMDSFSDDDKAALDEIDSKSPDPDGKYDWGEFLELYLVKLGMCNRADLDELREKFSEIDIDGSGKISQTEILAELELARIDVENDRTINFDEFYMLCHNIQEKYPDLYAGMPDIIKSEEKLQASFDEADKDKSGELDRHEVLCVLDTFATRILDKTEGPTTRKILKDLPDGCTAITEI